MDKNIDELQDSHWITVGGLQISFERTLKIPNDGKVYPLPPSLGSFPIYRVEDYSDKVPNKWREIGGYFIPMYQSEAMWLNFSGINSALIIDVGNTNVITGLEKTDTLNNKEQNYIVAPSQPWLDGFNDGDGYIRQFVAIPLQEEQLSTEKVSAGIRFVVFSAKPGLISDEEEELNYSKFSDCLIMEESTDEPMEGKLKQDIYPDEYGIDTWDLENKIEVNIHIANSEMFEKITGFAPPQIPLTAEEYNEFGYPWHELYNEVKRDIPGSILQSK